jgi:hypothetical protein|eukprot:COSAG01_NODE_2798_length_7055_cov_6.733611_3_plen_92_part_00
MRDVVLQPLSWRITESTRSTMKWPGATVSTVTLAPRLQTPFRARMEYSTFTVRLACPFTTTVSWPLSDSCHSQHCCSFWYASQRAAWSAAG